MNILADIRQGVQDDLTVGEESPLYNPTLIDRAINRAYRKAGSLFPWPELQDAKKTTTQANIEYYDYPQNWRSRSVWKLMVDGDRYGESPDGSPLSFDDYLNFKEDYPDSTDKKWANQWRRYFIFPVPTAASLEICIWGIMNVEVLDEDTDTTIFSYNAPECNEAIELEAVAILKNKGELEKAGEFRSMEAKQILSGYWGKVKKEMSKDEKNMPFFDIPNFFGKTSGQDLRGRFDIEV